MAAQVTSRLYNPRGGSPAAAYQFVDFSTDVPALNSGATAAGAAVQQLADGALCSASPTAAGQHFGVKFEKASGTWDLSDKMIAFDVEWLSSEGAAGYGQYGLYPEIWLCMDSGTTFTNYLRYSNMGSSYTKIPGRQTLLAPPNKFAATGSPNAAAVKRVEIRFTTQATLALALHRIKVFGFYQRAMTRPQVIIGFDDQYSSVYSTAFPLMEAYGFKGTMYVQPSAVGTSGRMTWAQLQELADAGWTIGSHPYTHKPLAFPLTLTWSGGVVTATSGSGENHNLYTGQNATIIHAYEPEYNGTFPVTKTSDTVFTYPQPLTPVNTTSRGFGCMDYLTDVEIEYYVETSIKEIYKNLTGPNIRPDIFSYANGAFSDRVVAVLERLGLTCCRTSSSGSYPGSGFMNWGTDAWAVNKFRHPSNVMLAGSTGASLLAYVDVGIPFGAMGQIYGHQVGAGGDISQAEFQVYLDGLRLRQRRGEIDVITQAKAAAMLGLQRTR